MAELAVSVISRETLEALKQGSDLERRAARALYLLTAALVDLQAELERVRAQSEHRRILLLRTEAVAAEAIAHIRRRGGVS